MRGRKGELGRKGVPHVANVPDGCTATVQGTRCWAELQAAGCDLKPRARAAPTDMGPMERASRPAWARNGVSRCGAKGQAQAQNGVSRSGAKAPARARRLCRKRRSARDQAAFERVADLAGEGGFELAEGDAFDLADAFLGNAQALAQLFQG